MRIGRHYFVTLLSLAILYFNNGANSGVLKSLDQELVALVAKTEPYLVTVKGEGGQRNLIATGIVYDSLGDVVTSSYACQANDFEITFKDGRSFPAKKVGVDNISGLAVLRIENGSFSPPQWGEASSLKEGSWIIVVGNSYGVAATVNFGNIDGRTDDNLLQLSVNVNPGASGGAVLDIDGEVIGVLVAREAGYYPESLSRDFLSASLGGSYALRLLDGSGASGDKCYAVPVETVHQIADQLIQAGKVRRGFLGISPRDLSTPERQKHGIVGGALVEEVDEGSPAQKAGLTKDDIIVAVDKVQVSNRASLHAQIRDHKPGDLIVVEYIRNGKRQTVKAILDEAKDESFMGGLALKPGFPNSKAFNKIEFFDREELRLQLSELKKQVQRLQSEIDQLKERPRGD